MFRHGLGPKPPPPARTQKLYVILAPEVQRVKVGITELPIKQRMSTIQSGSPVALTLHRVVVGGRDLEQQIHAALAHARVHGEWFEATPAVMRTIEKMLAAPPLPLPMRKAG